MATTYQLISSNVLTSTATSVTFSSIPATYTDLVVKFNARSSYSAGGVTNLYLIFNATTTGFSTILMENAFSSAQSQSFANDTAIYAGVIPNLSFGSSIFGTGEYYIPSYTVAKNKQIGISSVVEQNSTSGYAAANAGLWQNNATITSVKMQPEFGPLASGSSFYLYGIKNS